MQPYAIRKNRTYSLQAKVFIATLATTILVVSYRHVIGPYLRVRRTNKANEFAQEYIDKIENAK